MPGFRLRKAEAKKESKAEVIKKGKMWFNEKCKDAEKNMFDIKY